MQSAHTTPFSRLAKHVQVCKSQCVPWVRSWLDQICRFCATGGLPEGRPTAATRSSCSGAAGSLAGSARGLERQIWQLVPSGTGTASFCVVRSSVPGCTIARLYMPQLTRAVASPSTTRDIVKVVMCTSSLYAVQILAMCVAYKRYYQSKQLTLAATLARADKDMMVQWSQRRNSVK